MPAGALTAKGEPRRRAPGAGRPEGGGFRPTDDQRTLVKAMAGYRIPEDEIALLIINPATKRPVSPVTLRKHFHEEIRTGYATLRMRIMAATVRNALGVVKQGPNGEAIVEQQGNVTAQIWLQKTLYGARELVDVAPPNLTNPDDVSEIDAARRLAFTLALGARAIAAKEAPKQVAKPKR